MDRARKVVPRVEASAGEPAVVLEAGMNCGAASWQRVMPLLAPHVRVAAYDRAGMTRRLRGNDKFAEFLHWPRNPNTVIPAEGGR